eukprot:3343716-Pleurochrysis_carterae.AAC.1
MEHGGKDTRRGDTRSARGCKEGRNLEREKMNERKRQVKRRVLVVCVWREGCLRACERACEHACVRACVRSCVPAC